MVAGSQPSGQIGRYNGFSCEQCGVQQPELNMATSTLAPPHYPTTPSSLGVENSTAPYCDIVLLVAVCLFYSSVLNGTLCYLIK